MSKPLYTQSDYSREYQEDSNSDRSRSEFFRDYGRVIHSASFRRLQGKTQVFPVNESDFFRNRLTHSLEVSQIAEGIAEKINSSNGYFSRNKIDTKLVATAALVHDLGHPPFGHNGERALDDAMLAHGGFEGNAQTLRILSHNEKKIRPTPNRSFGLNLTYRTLAAALKYDNEIPVGRRSGSKVVKGYYKSESDLVRKIKKNVCGDPDKENFKTIECYIMDIADDIAYSTFDLEDCFKAGFLSPLEMISPPPDLLEAVAKKLNKISDIKYTSADVLSFITDLFEELFSFDTKDGNGTVLAGMYYDASREFIKSGTRRTSFSSDLVKQAISSIEVELNEENPCLSVVKLNSAARTRVEILKQYTYLKTIHSSVVKVPEYRGYELVKDVFSSLSDEKSFLLLPDDVRVQHEMNSSELNKQLRVVCDFVAGMTDRYAVEFYARLHSDSAQSMFKPL